MSLRILDNTDAGMIALKVLEFLEQEIQQVIPNPTDEEKEESLRMLMAGLVVAFSAALKA